MATTDIILTDREERTIHRPEQDWSDDFALKVALQDFTAAANYRSQSHEERWRDSDSLYYDYQKQKVWEGTRIPRANIPVHVVFKQVESLMPRFMDIFGDYPWADAEAYPGTSAEAARQHRDLVLYQFDETKGRKECRRAFKSGLIRGNGILEAGWEHIVRTRKRFIPEWRQTVAARIPTPQGVVAMPGPRVREVRAVQEVENINRPYLRYVSLFDFYCDPNIESPCVQEGRFAIKRSLVTLDYLKTLRAQPEDEGFQIPGDEELRALLLKRSSTQGDQSKREADSMHGIYRDPAGDTTADPGGKKLEVLSYVTADKMVWVLGREHVIYNRPNQYGQINSFNAFYTDVLDAFYGQSVADIAEGDHRLQRSLIEARVDDLSLNIHRQRYKKRGSNIPAYQLRRRPGSTIEMENPETDLKLEDIKPVTQEAFMEVAASDLRVQQVLGVTDQAVLGTAPSSGNAATRTATGSSIMAGAVGKRHSYTVETLEDEVMGPILLFFSDMNRIFLDPETKVQWLSNGKEDSAEAFDIMNAQIRQYKLHAGSRAKAKGLLQVLPNLLQTLLNPALIDSFRQEGKTVNFKEVYNLIADAADYRPREGLLRDLTPEEMQTQNQPPPEEMIRAQMQRERIQSADKNAEVKGIFELIKTWIQEETKKATAAKKSEADGSKAA